VPLVNNQPGAHPDIDLTITLTDAAVVNIRWNYAAKPVNVREPYQVPSNIVNLDLTPGTEPISKYVRWDTFTGHLAG